MKKLLVAVLLFFLQAPLLLAQWQQPAGWQLPAQCENCQNCVCPQGVCPNCVQPTAEPPMAQAVATTRHYRVTAPTQAQANELAQKAEADRKALAVAWLGKEMADGTGRSEISYTAWNKTGGKTDFAFGGGHVTYCSTTLYGDYQGVLKDVLPHEMLHRVLAYHYGAPVPRWADEGAAQCAESVQSQESMNSRLADEFQAGQAFYVRDLFRVDNYPDDPRRVAAFYDQSHAVAALLVQQKGRSEFITFLDDARASSWDAALRKHYALKAADLDVKWQVACLPGKPTRLKRRLERVTGLVVTIGTPKAPMPVAQAPQATVVTGPAGPQGPAGPAGPPGKPADPTQLSALQTEVNDLKQKLASLSNVQPASGTPAASAPAQPGPVRVRIVPAQSTSNGN